MFVNKIAQPEATVLQAVIIDSMSYTTSGDYPVAVIGNRWWYIICMGVGTDTFPSDPAAGSGLQQCYSTSQLLCEDMLPGLRDLSEMWCGGPDGDTAWAAS